MRFLFMFMTVFASLFVLQAPVVFAQTNPSDVDRSTENQSLDPTCNCFCKSENGAQDLGEREDEDLCRDSCKTQGNYYLGCYKDSEQFPENNALCWTQSDCESADSITSDELGSDWGGQEPQCPQGMGYCYNRVKPIQLGAAIDGVQEVDSFAQYIALIYAYLIPAASLVAIVLLMVGGLQYMLSGGREQAISKAKERMKNAIIGLVILLGAYSIAYLIDPNLVSFNELRIPRIRTVTYLDKDSSCEALEQKGVVVQPITTSQECGDEGRIVSFDALGEDIQIVGIEEGGTCLYHSCDNAIETCVSTPTAEKKYSCVRCAEAHKTLESIAPSDCARLQHELLDVGQNRVSAIGGEIYHYCEYDQFPPGSGGECMELTYPKSNSLNCKLLREDARDADSESCRAYDKVYVYNEQTAGFDYVYAGEYLTQSTTLQVPGTYFHTQICEEDPCGLAPPGGSCVTWGGLSDYGFVDCVDSGFKEQIDDAVLEPNAASRALFEVTGGYQITDVNGDPADFNPTW